MSKVSATTSSDKKKKTMEKKKEKNAIPMEINLCPLIIHVI